jgi:L,D-transpeptidase ErfK/SrfK
MATRHASRQILLAVPLAALLAGCSLIGKPWQKEAPPAPPPVVDVPPPLPPVPEYPLPVPTHRFELASAETDVVGTVQLTIASKEDTLPDIARRFNVGYEEIVRANPGVDPWLPGAGKQIVVPTRFILPNAPHEGVVINLAAMRLYYYPKLAKGETQQLVYTHPIGVGKVGWKTPEGVTKIISREKDPIWRPSAAVRKEHAENNDPIPAVVKAGPDNPLGKYKFTLGWASYLIHGTNKPYGVGLRSSHGCIRLYPEDIEVLFNTIPIGTPVRVVNQPFVFAYHDGELLLQAYTVLEDDARDWKKAQRTVLSKAMSVRLQKAVKENTVNADWDAIGSIAHTPRGIPVRVSGPAENVESVITQSSIVQNRIPDGANWDGADDIARDEASYQQVLREREKPATAATRAPRAAMAESVTPRS